MVFCVATYEEKEALPPKTLNPKPNPFHRNDQAGGSRQQPRLGEDAVRQAFEGSMIDYFRPFLRVIPYPGYSILKP